MGISEIWNKLSNIKTVPKAYAIGVLLVLVVVAAYNYGYQGEELYPKRLDNESNLYPYDRGGEPLENRAPLAKENWAQYPSHENALGWITSYLTPFSSWLASETPHLGTTIVSHPGGIMDEILYYTRGLDTVFEASILMMAFLLASYLMKRERRGKSGE
ncbi:hypothetical protein AKJ65_02645 [candidate division MSBL1 archaeon SCGC-AAA259E19]|uniref:NiFe hydrogenase n=1 Tax=candidate division MSBL1 archaeon SCGC-AAA259E19 TaxID=1698264 RepID=A0A133ULG7_9EURY|nr:hypothetical protein AKJ65_02645 [candidate division MSBL1 archaeon SCGC-AAA259E19]